MSQENINIHEESESAVMTVSSSPHIFSDDSVPKIMWSVSLALAPALLYSVYHFGMPALKVLLIGAVSAVVTELFVLRVRGLSIRPVWDGSALLSGILLAMCLPPSAPFYLPLIGSFIAIAVAKHSMGGLGQNIFNPAHIGRAALMVSWPIAMTSWTPMHSVVTDAVTTATPLNILKQQGYDKLIEFFGSPSDMYIQMLTGNRNGSIGETAVILLLLGGIFLIWKGYIKWVTPVTMIATVGILTWIFGPRGLFTGDPLFHVMAGGLIIGAFFMATDMVTTPVTTRGQILFAAGAGAITVLIRLLGGYPEGVCYSILLMNSVTPLIDRFVCPVRFGEERKAANVI